jgi:hypothetical protein
VDWRQRVRGEEADDRLKPLLSTTSWACVRPALGRAAFGGCSCGGEWGCAGDEHHHHAIATMMIDDDD